MLSHAVAEVDPREDELRDPRQYAGVSTWNRRDRAEKQARVFPWLGGFLVELLVPDDDDPGEPVAVFHTRSNGHFTVVTTPSRLLSYCAPGTCWPVTAPARA